MEQHLREEVGDLLRNAIRTHHCILKAILFTGLEPSERNPKERAITLHLIVVREFPVGHIAYHVHVLGRLCFASCVGAKRYARRVGRVIVDTIVDTLRTRLFYCGLGLKPLPNA